MQRVGAVSSSPSQGAVGGMGSLGCGGAWWWLYMRRREASGSGARCIHGSGELFGLRNGTTAGIIQTGNSYNPANLLGLKGGQRNETESCARYGIISGNPCYRSRIDSG